MTTYGQQNGIKFRVQHQGPLSIETVQAIKKMIDLINKSDGKNGQTHNLQTSEKPSHN